MFAKTSEEAEAETTETSPAFFALGNAIKYGVFGAFFSDARLLPAIAGAAPLFGKCDKACIFSL